MRGRPPEVGVLGAQSVVGQELPSQCLRKGLPGPAEEGGGSAGCAAESLCHLLGLEALEMEFEDLPVALAQGGHLLLDVGEGLVGDRFPVSLEFFTAGGELSGYVFFAVLILQFEGNEGDGTPGSLDESVFLAILCDPISVGPGRRERRVV